MTLEDIREMGRGDDLPSSPTDPSAVHRSFVQEQQNEQLAIARNLRRSVNLPSSSSSSRRSFNLPSSSSSEEQSLHHEEKTGDETTGRLKADEATHQRPVPPNENQKMKKKATRTRWNPSVQVTFADQIQVGWSMTRRTWRKCTKTSDGGQ